MDYIIIAEDDRDIMLLTQRKLELSGYTNLWTTADGQEALDQALADPPRLMILDIMLPSVDGLTICRTLKDELGSQAPIVLLTSARGQRGHLEEGRQAGADGYLIKPFSPSDLIAKIDALLDQG